MFMENNDFESKTNTSASRGRSGSVDSNASGDYNPRSSATLGSAGNLSTAENRKNALRQQRENALRKQANRRAFRGASRPIATAKPGSMRNFSAPKAIDPLDGEDLAPMSSPIRQTGYANSYKGGFNPNQASSIPNTYNSPISRGSSIEGKRMESPREAPKRAPQPERKPPTQERPAQPYGMVREPAYQYERKGSVDSHGGPPNRHSSFDFEDTTPSGPPSSHSQSNYKQPPPPAHRAEPRYDAQPQPGYGAKPYQQGPPPSSHHQSPIRPGAGMPSHGGYHNSHAPPPQQHQPYPDQGGYQQQLPPQSHPYNAGGYQQPPPQHQYPPQQHQPQQPYPAHPQHHQPSSQHHSQQYAPSQQQPAPVDSRRPEPKQARAPVVENPKSVAQPRHQQEAKSSADSAESKTLEDDLIKQGIPSTFDPTTDEADDLEEVFDEDEATPTQALDLSNMKAFLGQPTPKAAGVVQCYIERNKNGSKKMFPEYHLFLKDGDRFLMSSKKRAKNRTSNYVISMDQHDLSRESGSFVGKLRSNFLGTEFTVYDHGLNPKNADPDALKATPGAVRQELGCVTYASNVLGSRGPRKMKVAIPQVKDEGERHTWRPGKTSEQMLTRFKDKDMTGLTKLSNKPPRWNESVGAYVLNFNGRVTMASVKNFQLVTSEDQEDIVLQFGRVGKDLFTMDYQFPLSPLQAFAICLSSFDSKLACE